MRKVFFLLLELLTGLLILFSLAFSVQYSSSFSLSYAQKETACYDLLSVWLYGNLGQDELHEIALQLFSSDKIHISSFPFPSVDSKSAFACFASRHVSFGGVEELYILIES